MNALGLFLSHDTVSDNIHMMGSLLVVAGSSVSVALIIRPQFAFELGSKRNRRGEVSFLELIMWLSMGLVLILLGGLILLSTLNQIFSHCAAPGC